MISIIDVLFYDENSGEYFYAEVGCAPSARQTIEKARNELPAELHDSEFIGFDSPEVAEMRGFDTY